MAPRITRGTFGLIRRFVRGDGVRIVFQPITDLHTGAVVGFESLARFDATPARSPSSWFDEASAAGLRPELELATARAAVSSLSELPPHVFLTINASPDVATDPAFIEAVSAAPAGRLVVEITEHAPIEDYDAFNSALATMRSRGIRIAIDDAGAGFANMTHILRIDADLIKLDVELTRHIDIDARRRALVHSLVDFARSVGSTLVAEGIETEAELLALRSLGVACGQGYHLGYPAPPPGRAPEQIAATAPRHQFLPSVGEAFADARSFARMRSTRRRASRRRGGFTKLAAAMLLGTLVLGPATFAFADSATPGTRAYWLKQKIEGVRLLLALDRESEIRLHLTFARRRLNELSELAAEGNHRVAASVLADYGRHVDAVDVLYDPRDRHSRGLRARIVADLSDYVSGLDHERPGLCEGSGRAAACGSANKAASRSKRVLDRAIRSHGQPAQHPQGAPSPKAATPKKEHPVASANTSVPPGHQR